MFIKILLFVASVAALKEMPEMDTTDEHMKQYNLRGILLLILTFF